MNTIKFNEEVDPRIRQYLEEQNLLQARQSSPEYQRAQGQANLARDAGMQAQQDIASYGKAFAQLGTLGGKSTDASGLQQAADANNKRLQAAEMARAEDEQLSQERGEKRFGLNAKVADYVQQRKDKNLALDMERAKTAEDRQYAAARDQSEAARQAARDEKLFGQQMQLQQAKIDQAPPPKTPVVNPAVAAQDKEANYRYISLKNNADELKKLVEREGTSALTGPAGSEMDSKIYQMAVDYAKLVDPSSVAREGEVAAAQKYMLPFREMGGLTTRNKTALAQIDNYVRDLDARLAARQAAASGDVNAQTFSQQRQEPESGTAMAAEPAGPRQGDIIEGFKFLGGDPADPKSWEQQ